jgi:hypothetical protein
LLSRHPVFWIRDLAFGWQLPAFSRPPV